MSPADQQNHRQEPRLVSVEIPACLAVEEVAMILGVALKHVYYLLYMGRLDGWKIRSTWRLFRGSVEAYANERNDIGIVTNTPGNHDHQGSGRLPALLGDNRQTHDMGRPASGLHGRRGMEHRQTGPFRVSSTQFKPIKGCPEQPFINRSGQLEFTF
jgi:excisionase family DNA binding protein